MARGRRVHARKITRHVNRPTRGRFAGDRGAKSPIDVLGLRVLQGGIAIQAAAPHVQDTLTRSYRLMDQLRARGERAKRQSSGIPVQHPDTGLAAHRPLACPRGHLDRGELLGLGFGILGMLRDDRNKRRLRDPLHEQIHDPHIEFLISGTARNDFRQSAQYLDPSVCIAVLDASQSPRCIGLLGQRGGNLRLGNHADPLIDQTKRGLSDDEVIPHPELKLVLAQTTMKNRVAGILKPHDRQTARVPLQLGMLTGDSVVPRDSPRLSGPAQDKNRRLPVDRQRASPAVVGRRALGNQIRHISLSNPLRNVRSDSIVLLESNESPNCPSARRRLYASQKGSSEKLDRAFRSNTLFVLFLVLVLESIQYSNLAYWSASYRKAPRSTIGIAAD